MITIVLIMNSVELPVDIAMQLVFCRISLPGGPYYLTRYREQVFVAFMLPIMDASHLTSTVGK